MYVHCALENSCTKHWNGKNIIIGESKAIQMGLHDPPLCLEKRNCVSTTAPLLC